MLKIISSIALAGLVAATITGCSDKKPEPKKEETSFSCKQENVLAPKWTCIPVLDGYYAGVGIAEKSNAGIAHMRKVALANGRGELAQQIQTDVKDRVQNFTRATGNGDKEVVDKVSTSVTDQLARSPYMKKSKAVDYWEAPSGTIYMLVTVSLNDVNEEVKKTVSSSVDNKDALWQQFQSKQALDSLNEAFPTN